ncbi:MAG TPA: response regulator [Gallionellaceae bacterium]
MQKFEERLEHFSQSAADAIDSLMSLVTVPPAAGDAGAAKIMLRRYCELVQRIGQLASESGLSGLQSACALVETNLLLLQDEKRKLNEEESALLESWPMLLFGYLANRADRASSSALVENLSTNWPLTMPDVALDEELDLLMGKGAHISEPETVLPAGQQHPEMEPFDIAQPEQGEIPPAEEPAAEIAQEIAQPSAFDPWPQAKSQFAVSMPPAEAPAAASEPIAEISAVFPESIFTQPISPAPEPVAAEPPLDFPVSIFSEPPVVAPEPVVEEASADIPESLFAEAPAFAHEPAAEEPTVAGNPFGGPPTGVQTIEREMLAILAKELKELDEDFSAGVNAALLGTDDEKLAALANLLDFLERVRMTVESVGLTALAAWFTQVGWQLATLGGVLEEKHRALLLQLPGLLSAYLATPDNEAASSALAAMLTDSAWPSPLSREDISTWQAALGKVELTEGVQLVASRPTLASAQDVTLELPADVNSELLDGLLQELPVQAAAFTSAITNITGGNGGMGDAKQAMRAAHTLKGAANTVGLPGIANLTHHLEDILAALIEAEKLPQGALSRVLIQAADCLETMSEFLLGLGPAPDNSLEVLQQVLDCANRMDREGPESMLAETAAPLPAMQASAPVAGNAERRQATPQPASTDHSIRVPAPLMDELLRLAGETLISNSQLQDHLHSSIVQNEAIRKQHRLFQQILAELEHLVDIRGITSPQLEAEKKGGDFDALEFEHYNELQTIGRRLLEAATDVQELADNAEAQLSALDELLEEQQRLQMANQHALLRTRMVPVSSMVSRLQRSVRQTGRLLDKEVEFVIKGEHTSLDSNLLNDLMDPLMHMLRNAVDHGIENPEARRAAGKPPQGQIELSFAREGNSIVVRCRDDGAGLNYEAIRHIAESKGLIKPGHVHSNDELARMILVPGFSTRDAASQVSGRGVGMDVVYGRVQAMKGMLSLDSRPGHGLMVELRLPATLLSAHVLIIRQREKRLAISTRGIEDIRYVTREQFMEIGTRQFFRDGEKLYSLLKLESMLSMPSDRRAKDRQGFPVLLTRLADGSERAVLVQEIIESREVVMKKFGRYVPQVQGVVGAVILGDGGVAPVIDLVELLVSPVQLMMAAQKAGARSVAYEAPEKTPLRALVVDDSLSARRAVVQVLKDADLEVRTANDGLDAIAILDKWVPDIIISDMEMPRMNGLELTANVRHAERTRHIPVIMVTSRSTAKHRQMSKTAGVSAHIVKPFNDDDLVQQVLELTKKQP